MSRIVPIGWLVAIALLGAGTLLVPELAAAARLLFLVGGAAPIGAALLLAIARLTGAPWHGLAPLARPLPWVIPGAVLALSAGWQTPLPTHLALWSHPLFVAGRGAVAVAALAWATRRIMAGAGQAFAGLTLAAYAWLATPIAADWLVGLAPGYPVSASGMMLFVQQIAAACAVALALGLGGERFGRDMAGMLIAAALGVCYLAYVEYLIAWYGNLPLRVPFHLVRGTPGMAALAIAALAIGLLMPIALLARGPDDAARRRAGLAALVGLALYHAWWLGGGSALPCALVLILAGPPLLHRAGRVHG